MNAPTTGLPVVVVGAGPIGLAAAAHLIGQGIEPLVLEAGPAAGAAVREWSHVRLFSTWGEVVDPAAEKLLAPTGWTRPDPAGYPPLRLEECLELLAIGEAIARYVRHPAEVHRAALAGATWAQMGQAVGQEPDKVGRDYEAWAVGQRHLYAIYDGKLGLDDAEYAAVLARAGGERR